MAENVVSSEKEKPYENTFGLIGTKVGMSRVFGADGESIPVTVIKFGVNVVSSLKLPRRMVQCCPNWLQRS